MLLEHTCFGIDRSFKKKVRELEKEFDVPPIRCKTIRSFYYEINKRDNLVKILEQNDADFSDVKKIIVEHNYKNHNSKDILDAHKKSKEEKLGLSVDQIIKLNKENRNIKRIIDRLAKSKRKSKRTGKTRQVTPEELKTLYFVKNENFKLLRSFVKTKKEVRDIEPELFIKANFSNINPEELADVLRLLAMNRLSMPDKILISLFDKKINILKTIKVLSDAKKESLKTLTNMYPFFSDKDANKLANAYTVEGKNKLKTKLSSVLLKMNRLEDPADIYMKLVKSEGKGFKINLETIRDYIIYDFTPNIDKVSRVYQHARNNGLIIQYRQIAKLAEKEVDIEAFINAEIKNKKIKDEEKNRI